MTDPVVQPVAIDGYRAAVATGIEGAERKLLDIVLRERHDVVFLTDAPARSVSRLERAGLACKPVAMNGYDDALTDAAADIAADGPVWALLPMLDRSVDPIRCEDYRIEPNDVVRYGETSGDTNPLHFDDAYAKSLGFEGRISHGMIFNGYVSRLLGTIYPGPGTIYLQQSTSYFAPIYPGRDYEMRASTPWMDAAKGLYRVLVQLRLKGGGQAGQSLAMLSYNDVLKRA